MAKILICGPFGDDLAAKINYASPPMGPHRICAWLRKHGHEAVVYDYNINGEFCHVLALGWDIIGFSSLQSSLINDIRAAEEARYICPNATIVFGGIESTLNYQEVLDSSPCDYVVLGEGEEFLLGLAEGKPITDLSGYIVKKTRLPLHTNEFIEWWESLDFADMQYEKYWQQTRELTENPDEDMIRTIRLVTSSHCNHGCVFCSVTRWKSSAEGGMAKVKYLPPQDVYALVEKAIKQVPSVRSFYFCEDDFIVTKERAYQSFELLGKTGKQFLIQTRLDKLDKELIEYMGENGCRHITIGIENASSTVQKALGKPLNNEDISKVITWCKESNITPYLLFILFCPTATMDDMRINYSRISEWIEQGATVSIEPNMMCYRGSPLWDSNHDMLYRSMAMKRRKFRYPYRVLPDDPQVRELSRLFNECWPSFMESKRIDHTFKGNTGRYMIELLGELLACSS